VTGQTLVVLIGGIDLSVPWVLTGAAILLVTSSGGDDGRALLAVAPTPGMGLAVGPANGLGTAYLAVPAVVMTLGMTCVTCSSYAPPAVRSVVGGRTRGLPTDLLF
jgi:ribose transport system permease protein